MKLLEKVPSLQVKRCFVTGDLLAKQVRTKKKNLDSQEQFLRNLASVKKRTQKMNRKTLDAHILWKKRLHAYDNTQWYLGEVTAGEVGVWARAGNLSLRWTNKTLAHTARCVKKTLEQKRTLGRVRGARAVRGILTTSVDVVQKDNLLLPIIFKHDTGTRGRKRLKYRVAGDIDDGCMRSIALAVHGVSPILAYVGMPKKEQLTRSRR